jgi:DNA-binding transcriptional activator of the SARP family
MGILQIRLLGRVQVSHGDWLKEVKTTKVVQGLLAYLLLHRNRTHSREVLADLFWGEQHQEKACGCLNTTLWRLRRVLEPDGIPPGTYLVSNHMGEVGFNQESKYWLDVAILEEQIHHTLAWPYHSAEAGEVKKLENSMQVYRGDLLEGCYDDWALRERERIRDLYLNGLAYLMHYEKYHGSYEKGLVYGGQILKMDPLREEIHRDMIRLYIANGQRALAVRQYETCCEILRNELKIEPMEETKRLYTQIVSDAVPAASFNSKNDLMSIQEILNKLAQAAQTAEQLQDQLYKAIGSIKARRDNKW